MDFVNGRIIHKQDKKDNIILINFKAHYLCGNQPYRFLIKTLERRW